MKYRIICLAQVLALLLAAGCAAPPPADPEAGEQSVRYLESMDTIMSLTAYGPNRESALDEAEAEILRLDAMLSIGAADSDVSRVNRDGGGALPEDMTALIARALALYEDTGGQFDITISPLMDLWGFYSKDYHVPTEKELAEALAKVGSDRVRLDADAGTLALDAGQAIDLGGIAKGYTSQRIVDLWREAGLTSGLVSLGGNIQCLGAKPDGSVWRIGIRDPDSDSGEIAAVAEVTDKAVITSGGYERFFTDGETGRTYQHILDPHTGYPVDTGLASVSVITDDGALGDGLSTALYTMGLEKAADYWRAHSGDFQAVFIDEDGGIYITQGLDGAVSSQRELHILARDG